MITSRGAWERHFYIDWMIIPLLVTIGYSMFRFATGVCNYMGKQLDPRAIRVSTEGRSSHGCWSLGREGPTCGNQQRVLQGSFWHQDVSVQILVGHISWSFPNYSEVGKSMSRTISWHCLVCLFVCLFHRQCSDQSVSRYVETCRSRGALFEVHGNFSQGEAPPSSEKCLT